MARNSGGPAGGVRATLAGMTPEELAELLTGDRTPAFGPARDALLAGWFFQLFLDVTASTVLACLRSGPLGQHDPADPDPGPESCAVGS